MTEIVGACLSQYHDDEDKFELLLAYADGREIGHTVSRASAKKIAAEFASEFSDTPAPNPKTRATDSFGNDLIERELVSVVLRMSRHILAVDTSAAKKLNEGALGYLRRKGLMPSPLRADETVVQSATTPAPLHISVGCELAIAIIEARLPLYTDIGQINALRECVSSIRGASEQLSVPDREYLARAIDPNAWSRHDTLVGFIRDRRGADTYQETYGFMWRAGVRTEDEAKHWLMNDGTRVGWDLKDSLAIADRVIAALAPRSPVSREDK